MSEKFKHGDRVVVTCHQVHTTYGGLTTESHEHTGTVDTVSIYGNVWVHLDDSHGPSSKWNPASVRAEVTA